MKPLIFLTGLIVMLVSSFDGNQIAPTKSPTLAGVINEASEATGVPAAVLHGIATAETGGHGTLSQRSVAVSRSGAIGLMQIMPQYAGAQSCPGVRLTDPRQNALCAARYIQWIQGAGYCEYREVRCIASSYLNGPAGHRAGRFKADTTVYLARFMRGYNAREA